MRTIPAAMLAFALPLLAVPAAAQEAAPKSLGLKLDGKVKTPATYTVAQLRAMPATSVTVSFQGHEDAGGTWKGVALAALVEKVGTVEEKGHGAFLQHVIMARGTDGYAVGIAMGEIDPKFEGKAVTVAYEKDGKPLDSLRLIVPNDAHAGRSVRNLAELTVN